MRQCHKTTIIACSEWCMQFCNLIFAFHIIHTSHIHVFFRISCTHRTIREIKFKKIERRGKINYFFFCFPAFSYLFFCVYFHHIHTLIAYSHIEFFLYTLLLLHIADTLNKNFNLFFFAQEKKNVSLLTAAAAAIDFACEMKLDAYCIIN